MAIDYTTVTEVPGLKASREQLAMLYTRYAYAGKFCDGKDVLEVGCGTGQGLGYLATKARKVIGGDYTENLITEARQYYGGRIPLLRLDAHALPFQDATFGVVILYEAIYYLIKPQRFLEECRRTLREKGTLVICTVNKEWSEFNPSPFSTQYFSVRELSALLKNCQFSAEFFGAFSTNRKSAKDQFVSWARRSAVRMHLIPGTMRSKEFLKRFFLGPLFPVPPEVHEGVAPYCPPVPLSDDAAVPGFKVLFAVARPS